MALKLSTFNCRGLQDRFKRKKVFNFLRQRCDDIIFLQETHSHSSNHNIWTSEWGGKIVFSSYASNSRGTAILLKPSLKYKINDSVIDVDGRFIILDIIVDELPVILVNTYAPNQDNPDFFFDLFAKIENFNTNNLIIGGDFNIAVGSLDYQGSCSHHSNVNARDAFNVLVN
jgi:exonuclease III